MRTIFRILAFAGIFSLSSLSGEIQRQDSREQMIEDAAMESILTLTSHGDSYLLKKANEIGRKYELNSDYDRLRDNFYALLAQEQFAERVNSY